MRKVPITTYLEFSEIEKLETLSRKLGKSLSGLLREATQKFLEEKQ